MRSRVVRHRFGFTLVDAALTTVIMGVAFVAMLQLLAAGTAANVDASALTTGSNLARNIRELTLNRTVAQVRALHGTTYQPAVDSRGTAIADAAEWKQAITVQTVNPELLTQNIIDANGRAVRVTTTVSRRQE